MSRTASDFLVERLHEWGVRRIYGYPGDGIDGVLGALSRAEQKIRFVQAAHEELAAFMACGHAKFTGEVGVCLATSGPGAIHLLNGLYDAKKDHVPVVAIVGQQPTIAIGADFQQEIDLLSLFKDVACDYVQMASTASQFRQLVDQAMRIAKGQRTVTCIILPNDLQEAPAEDAPPREHGASFTGVGYTAPRIVPEAADLDRAAEVLDAGSRVAMLVGAGCLGAEREVLEIADKLGAGVAKALLGKAVVPDDVPFCTGPIGMLGSRASWELMQHCDTLLMVGTTFPYAEFLPKEGQARAVQIDLRARALSLRYPAEVNLHGDTRETLRELLPRIQRKTDRAWRESVEKNVAAWWKLLEARAALDANPINPQRVFWELSSQLPDRAILTADSGTAAIWYARDVKLRAGMMGSLSGGLATMCPAVPYALAAKLAYPDRPVIALVGDGAMQMLGNNALVTVMRHASEWSDPRFVVCVLNNSDLNMVTWEQRILSGDARFAASQEVPAFSYAKYAEQVGFLGIELRRPADVANAWRTALDAGRPALIDAHTDPNVPPLPPHVTVDQAKAFLSSVVAGDPDAKRYVRQSLEQMAAGWRRARHR